ncbi:retrovirus-related Pol polyprotein from transposon opus [Trichonephila clavata]|uniref:Retrovirus-related Pol polyprotein from transposon opus n=1 Tax=Trichonephila clavata TaxID=2740835 RepID=A0A8X6G2J9_TRICU|nr:retrovirus-related Pol polyprotein from transposon opus [Trichonephila clavata]
MNLLELKEKLMQSKAYLDDEQFVKDILATTVENRKKEKEYKKKEEEYRKKEKEYKNKEEEYRKKEEENIRKAEERRLEREHELALARIQETRNIGNSNGEGEVSIDKLMKAVVTLTLTVPTKSEGWNVFFNSQEKAFKHKRVPEEFQAEILLKFLGDKASNVLVFKKEEDLREYAKVKTLILKEFEPTPQGRMKNEFMQSRRNPITNSNGTDTANGEAVVARVESSYLQSESNQNIINPLKRIPIFIDSKEIDAIVDSGTQIAIVNSSLVPKLKEKEGSRIVLTPAFGKQIEAKVCHVTIYFKNYDSNLFNIVDTLVAVTNQLNVLCLVTPKIHQLLTNPAEGEIGSSGGVHEEGKALALHFETEEECIGEKTPPGHQAQEQLGEKTKEPR